MPPRIGRRAFIAASAAAALPLSLQAGPNGSSTLRVSATPSIFKPTFEQLSREFQRRHPGIRVELMMSARDQLNQIQNTLRQALIGDVPDVSFQGTNFLRLLKARRIAFPLNDCIRNDREWNAANYGPSVIETGSVDKSVIGLGTAMSMPLIYMNEDLVRPVLGADPMPQDWERIVMLVNRLASQAKPGTLGGFLQHRANSWIYMALVSSLGGSMMDEAESRLVFDEPAGRQALRIYEAFGRAGQARADMGREQARQAFAGGAIALLIDSSSSLEALQRQIGGRFKLGTAKLPVAANGSLPAGGIAATMLTRDPSRQTAAWEYMKFVVGPAAQTLIGKTTGYFPANEVVIERADLLGDYYAARPLVRPIVESLPFASRWYAFPGDNSAKIDAVMVDGVDAVVTLAKTPDQALTAMKRAVEILLPERRT